MTPDNPYLKKVRGRLLENFREIYEAELANYESNLANLILGSTEVRMFVYEVCKACVSQSIVAPTAGDKK